MFDERDFLTRICDVVQPEFYLLDAEGNVLKKFIGYTSQETLEEEFIKYIE